VNAESTPKGAHESATTAPSVTDGTDFTAEDRHAAFVAGYEQGKAERIEIEIQAQVQARLHQISLEALGMARRLARAKGPAWSALIAECGESE
jgi:hypothetical protein